MAEAVRYRWKLLRAGEFRLDGGSMFGLVPRVVWGKSTPTDERGRITVQHNCLLLERVDEPSAHWKRRAPKLVVLETGSGDKMDPKSRDIFALEQRSIVEALHEVSCRPEDVGLVTATHLHFDHAGGLTRLVRAGESADWTDAASGLAVKRTFSNARVVVQAREWSDALANRSVMTRTYFRDHLEPIREQIEIVESPAPFARGLIPDRDQLPATSATVRMSEIAPGLEVFLVPGHTWGQQAMTFVDEKGERIVFTPDVLPTRAHLGAAFSLAYDVEPYTSMVSKRWFLTEAAERGWTLVLDHEPGACVVKVRRKNEWFELVG
jgi:glyoxylase-like metal-dependent hydrolase (beta-lactamase superfamily II)